MQRDWAALVAVIAAWGALLAHAATDPTSPLLADPWRGLVVTLLAALLIIAAIAVCLRLQADRVMRELRVIEAMEEDRSDSAHLDGEVMADVHRLSDRLGGSRR